MIHGSWSFISFTADPRPLCPAAMPVWISSILARNRFPPSVCLLDGVGPVQSNICFSCSRLPKSSLPTSPHHAPLVYSPSFGEAWRNHGLYLGISEFFHVRNTEWLYCISSIKEYTSVPLYRRHMCAVQVKCTIQVT